MNAFHLSGIVSLLLAVPPLDPATSPAVDAPGRSPSAEAYGLFFEAQELITQGRVKEARQSLTQVVQLDPLAVSVHALLSRLCLRDGDLACAESEAQRAVQIDPKNGAAHKVLADLFIGKYRRGNLPAMLEQALAELAAAAAADPRDASVWVGWIRLLGTEGRVDAAIDVAQRASAVPGVEPAGPWLALARVLMSRGEADRAIKLLEDVSLSGRGVVPVLETLADLKASRGDLAGQEQTLMRLRDLNPEDPDVGARLGGVRLDLGDPYGALEPLSAAHQARIGDPAIARDLARALVRLGRGVEALPLLESMPESYRSAHTLLLWAQAAEQAKSWKLAGDRLEELTTRLSAGDRDSFGAAVQLRAAKARLQQGLPGRALELTKTIGDDISAIRLRQDAYRALGQKEEARRELKTQLAKHSADPALSALQAESRLKDGGGDAESAALELMLTELRDLPERTRAAAEVARWLAQFDHARLAARLLDAVGLPENPAPELLRVRATTLDLAGRSGEAEAALRQVLIVKPDDDGVMNDLGYLLTKEGHDLDEAIRLLERAVQLRPEEPSYLDSLGFALHRAGRSAEALPILRRAASRAVDRDEPEIREHLGDVYAALGDPDRARAEWNAALWLGGAAPDRLKLKLESLSVPVPGDATPR